MYLDKPFISGSNYLFLGLRTGIWRENLKSLLQFSLLEPDNITNCVYWEYMGFGTGFKF